MLSKLKNYFDKSAKNPNTIGIYPMGTGLQLEIPYRHYWENKNFLLYISNIKKPKLLELGCGAGRWAVSLSHITKEYIGIDISACQIKIAKEKAKAAGLKNITFLEAEIENLKDDILENIDVVYSAGVFQYIEDDKINLILNKVKKHLSEGGLFIDRSTFIIGDKRTIKNDDKYYCIYRTQEEFLALFKEHGFINILNDRSYVYLRGGKFFKNHGVKYLVNLMITFFPWFSFRFMKFISLMYESKVGFKYIEEESGIYTHNFTVYKLAGEASNE